MEYFFYDDDAIFFTLSEDEQKRYDELNEKGMFVGITSQEKEELTSLFEKGMKPYREGYTQKT